MKKRGIVIGIVFLGLAIILAAVTLKTDRGIQVESVPRTHETYVHENPDFLLDYPQELEVEEYVEEDGVKTVVFAHPGNEAAREVTDKSGFQIFITPYEDKNNLTRERILEDLPEAVIEEPLVVIVNPSAPEAERIEGLTFWSASPDIGRTKELWFVRDGFLYEITTYAHLDEWLGKIMDSWRFKL